MKAQDVAFSLKAWAQENNLLQEHIPVPLENTDEEAKDALFDSLAITALSERILRNRHLTGIAYNDATNEVVVFTAKKITAKEQKVLPSAILQEVSVKYVHGGAALAGVPTAGKVHIPYTQHEGRYTCGSSIHPARVVGAGTLGCLVKDEFDNLYGLTNNHVSGMCNYSYDGEKILAPGHIDVTATGIDPFTIGYHHQSLPMAHGLPDNIDISTNQDAAIIRIANADKVSSLQGHAYDTPAEAFELEPGQVVQKVGRTTGTTSGTVIAQMAGPFPVTYNVPGYGTHLAYFENVMVIRGQGEVFSQNGDSGALITTNLNGQRYGVGLVFAGDAQGLCYALPLKPILESFNVSLVSNHHA